MSALVLGCLLAAALLSTPLTASARDMSAETGAFLYDLLAPFATGGGAAPAGIDPAVLKAALAALRHEKLPATGRPPTIEGGLVEQYGRALLLGTRAPQFAKELGEVRDQVIRGDSPGAKAAIQRVFTKAGRKPPEGEALDKLLRAVGGAADAEPAETEQHQLNRPDYTIDILNAKRAGQVIVDVELKNGPGGQPARAVFAGDVVTQPDARGKDLERKVTPQQPCTISAAESAALRDKLNGVWSASGGQGNATSWEIAGAGEQIVLGEKRTRGAPLEYSGRYVLGRITAFHPFGAIDDIRDDLPADVRAQLVAWQPKLGFTVRLEACARGERLPGTWSSQHVTYGSLDHRVSKVHNPYDVRLVLSREVKTAQGGRWPDEGP